VEQTDWLDTTPAVEPQKVPSAAAPPPADDEWLNIEDANAGRFSREFSHLIDACMRGTNRVMACDGTYMAYRPFNRAFDKEVNPRTAERMHMFLEKGHYKHLGTYDEVQIYELLEGNPYRQSRKQYVVGQDYWRDIRDCVKAAMNRDWATYHDLLQAIAMALKGGNRDPAFARTIWDDTVNQICAGIRAQGPDAPTDKEVNEGFTGVRQARGLSTRGSGIVTLNSNALQKVGFTK
jgi:hypothetical protein